MTKHFYVHLGNKKYFEERYSSSYYRKEALSVKIIDQGIILPPMPAKNSFNLPDIEVGVLNQNKEYITRTGMTDKKQLPYSLPGNVQYRYSEVLPFSLPTHITYINKEVIWGGFIYNHYGHFLLQSTTRLYYYLKNRDVFPNIAFSVSSTTLPKYVEDFFDLLGITQENITLITNFTQFKKVVCPELSSYYYKDWTEEFILPFAEAAKGIPPNKDKKIFFSRKYWGKDTAKCIGEDALEDVFNKNGYKSVYMEKLTLQEQIAVMKGGEVFAGINGTAFHNILFASPKKMLQILNRTNESNSQYIINDAMQADCYIIEAYESPLPVNHAHGPFIVGLTRHVKEFFKDFDIDCFGKQFYPQKYYKQFLDLYLEMYSKRYYSELSLRKKDKIEVKDMIFLLENIRGRFQN